MRSCLLVMMLCASAGPARADGLWRTIFGPAHDWPWCYRCGECDDYCPPPEPCPRGVDCFQCDDYQAKCEPRLCAPHCGECDDYVCKPWPAVCCPDECGRTPHGPPRVMRSLFTASPKRKRVNDGDGDSLPGASGLYSARRGKVEQGTGTASDQSSPTRRSIIPDLFAPRR